MLLHSYPVHCLATRHKTYCKLVFRINAGGEQLEHLHCRAGYWDTGLLAEHKFHMWFLECTYFRKISQRKCSAWKLLLFVLLFVVSRSRRIYRAFDLDRKPVWLWSLAKNVSWTDPSYWAATSARQPKGALLKLCTLLQESSSEGRGNLSSVRWYVTTSISLLCLFRMAKRQLRETEERKEGSLHWEVVYRTVSFSENPYLKTLFNW